MHARLCVPLNSFLFPLSSPCLPLHSVASTQTQCPKNKVSRVLYWQLKNCLWRAVEPAASSSYFMRLQTHTMTVQYLQALTSSAALRKGDVSRGLLIPPIDRINKGNASFWWGSPGDEAATGTPARWKERRWYGDIISQIYNERDIWKSGCLISPGVLHTKPDRVQKLD